MKTYLLFAVIAAATVALALLLGACASTHTANAKLDPVSVPDKLVYVKMATTAGDIFLELDNEHAPISVTNFLAHARRSDYDNTIFHRVIPEFVIQGGGFTKDLTERAKLDTEAGFPDPAIKNEWQNGLRNLRGTIAMARDEGPDTATREFYINTRDNAKLDTARDMTGHAGYAVFGHVIAGMDVVDHIRMGKTTKFPDRKMEDVPVDPVVIKSVKLISATELPASATPGRMARAN